VFDEKFFAGEFADRASEFLDEHGGLGVEFVTVTGERLDILAVESTEGDGMTLVTRSERLVFLPYAQLAYIEMAGQRDHRIASFRLSDSAS